MRTAPAICSAAVLLGLVLAPAYGQVSRQINAINTPKAQQGVSLSMSVDLSPTAGVQRLLLRYREFGVTEYKQLEMLLAGRSATVALPSESVQPPYLQYYLVLELQDGSTVTYPEAAPELNPLQLAVQQVDPREKEVRFLSPEPGETVAQEDFVLAVSLYFAGPAIAPTKTKIIVDGVDVSREAVLSDDIILWSPANSATPVKLGAHTVRVELRDTSGNPYYSIERSFSLSTTAAIAEEESRLHYDGDVRAEYRNENTANAQTYARLDARTNGTYSFMNFGGSLRLDNLESPSRQPQNRFTAFVDAEYARMEVGDSYPRFPSLMMVGKRMRGLNSAVRLGFFNLDLAFGATERSIEGVVLGDTTFADSNAVRNRPENTLSKNGSYFTYQLFGPGTYGRDFFGIRPSFGSGENFQLGFTYLKFKDDMGSARYAINPKENLVVGTDLTLAFDDQRIRWETQVAVGLQNKNIAPGNFTDAEYDSLKAQGTDVKAMGKIAQDFITVNENLEPLNPAGTGLPGIALESFFTANYFNNYIRAQFIRRGTAYKTFGNEFLQADIQGLSVSDNVRLLGNRLFASLSYETKADNLSKNKSGTTSFNTLSGAITYSPGTKYPTMQLGYGLSTRLNDQLITPSAPALADSLRSGLRSSKSADDAANRITLGLSYDFSAGVRHFATFSLNTVDRKDRTIYRRDQTSTFLQASVTSFYAIPMQTTIGILTSSSKSGNQFFDVLGKDSTLVVNPTAYSTLSLGAQYRLMEDALRLSAQVAPTFGDVKRTAIRFGGDYTVAAHVFELFFDYYQAPGQRTDSILSFVYRYNF